jgi:hypothetical protein
LLSRAKCSAPRARPATTTTEQFPGAPNAGLHGVHLVDAGASELVDLLDQRGLFSEKVFQRMEAEVDRFVRAHPSRVDFALWWSLVIWPQSDESESAYLARRAGYTEAALWRAMGQFRSARVAAQRAIDDGYGDAGKLQRLTPIHKHIHRLAERDGWICSYCPTELVCSCDLDLGLSPAVSDHVFPRSRGGSNADSNRALACIRCNGSKGDKTVSEWGGPR